MKKLIYFLLSFSTIYIFGIKANENFSVEIEALTLVMEKYQEEIKGDGIEILSNPNYVAFKLDECNATVEITEKTGLQVNNVIAFDVDVCNKEIIQIINN